MESEEMRKGWNFAAQLAGASSSTQIAHSYIAEIKAAIEQMENAINNHPYRGQDIAQFKGYVAEEWHGGTFNIDATAAGATDRATVLHSNGAGSVDIQLISGKAYSAKVYADGAKTAAAQSAISPDTGETAYKGQQRLIPRDQMDVAKAAAHRQALRNQEIRPRISEAYADTESNLTSQIESDDGIKSIPKDKRDFEEMARSGKMQEFQADDHGVTLDSSITTEYMIRQAICAGYTAAAVTVAIQLAPEIYKSIDYLIKHKKIDIQRIKRMGEKGLTAGAEGFLRGSIACSIQIMCEKGTLGAAFTSVDPMMVGSVVAIVMGTVKNSLLVAAGKMTAKQMGAAFVDSIVVTSGYVIGAKVGGIIGQAIGFDLPVVGYLLGSFVGCAFASVYNIGKKKLISFCKDTGFTCFGLVEQNYEVPVGLMNEIGIDTIPITRIPINRISINRIPVNRVPMMSPANEITYETIVISELRKGIIGINKVAYTL